MGATQRVSMTDVARRAGVSQKTVSRVVNGEPHVADAIRARVQAVIEEMGFRPNAAARALVTRRNRRIGMVTMGTALYGPTSILAGVDAALRGTGYHLSVARTQGGGVADLQAAIDELVAQDIAGLVLSEPIDLGHPELRLPAGLPVLTFDSPTSVAEAAPDGVAGAGSGVRSGAVPDGAPGAVPGVEPGRDPAPEETGRDRLVLGADELTGARSATEHLLTLGHRTVHHIAGTAGWAATARRIAGWRSALADTGAPLPDVVHGDWSPRSGYEATRELLRHAGSGSSSGSGSATSAAPDSTATPVNPVTAIFAANDHMAIGAIRAVEQAGLRVPQDVSVVGFDDAPEAEFLSTPLTTVRQDFAEVTRLAVHRLVRAMEGRPPAERHRLIPTELVVRETTAPPPDSTPKNSAPQNKTETTAPERSV
ncbi:LacI family DNA-binding transcriptional regulator [Promicromonospora sukumoe]|uniref:DNA-binding LacI/PurR family transcriptional regulator n=1 Tax=Promicromonospora sukumoe TaxID=88382 RepID=A0A7W3PE62_9MICO|nr:LacI family DNA-binding transcriptional regulator [Promicromonospora sukumoe]MBA8808212.1 DNA-binding LacI/PurR family transcriptional regulator [Promicromonospora sukumoe]